MTEIIGLNNHSPLSKCVEHINLGFSSYNIINDVYKINIGDGSLTLTIGIGTHNLEILDKEFIIRLYNYPADRFPTIIERDTIQSKLDPTDQYLLFETKIDHLGNSIYFDA